MTPVAVARPAAPRTLPQVRPPALHAALPGLTVRRLALADPLARPLLDGLAAEYRDLHGHPAAAVEAELASTPAADFDGPAGCLLVLLHEGVPVAGGAYRRASATTAELKRIWTAPAARRLGLGRRVVEELHARAAEAGYRHVVLTTGARQVAAHRLYRSAGYRPDAGTLPGPGTDRLLVFRRDLPVAAERAA